MIISDHSSSENINFEQVLSNTWRYLQKDARKRQDYYLNREGRKLESDVHSVMVEQASGTEFDGSIHLVSGQKFPDIIAKKFYGVEVKTTTQNHWKTTGNSVLESTRAPGVERIYLMFGKLVNPVEFRYRRYEECLPEVVVTHSPRYLIDMDTNAGQTIFDKMNLPYDELRKRDNPLGLVTDYYRGKLKEGEDVWWLGKGQEETPTNFSIRLWENLEPQIKESLRNEAMAFFPEIFGTNPNKYSKVSIFLVMRHGIVVKNVRDIFTAGGQSNISVQGRTYENQPKIFKHLFDNLSKVLDVIIENDPALIAHYWGKPIQLDGKERIKLWQKLVLDYASNTMRGRENIMQELPMLTSRLVHKL